MIEQLPAYLLDMRLQLLLIAVLVVLALLLVLHRRSRKANRPAAKAFSTIAFERIDGLVVPNGDEGEIIIDHLLLTAKGLLVIDVKEVYGTVFGSDKMQEWTVISEGRRFTFANPQPALYDRIAAIRAIVGKIPVAGRILFLDGASFTKGVPRMVCSVDELIDDFVEKDKVRAKAEVEVLKPAWENIRARAVAREKGKLYRYRHG